MSAVVMPGTFDVEITFTAVKGSALREAIVPPRPDGTAGQVNPNFSPAIRVGNRLFASAGIGSTDANAGDMKAQTTEALTRLGLTLKAAGFDYTHVVAADVFITDVAQFSAMNDGYRPFFPPIRRRARQLAWTASRIPPCSWRWCSPR